MRIVLLLGIRMYWRLIPAHKRRRCIFKKSCSHFVFEKATQEGLASALKAFRYRFNTCRPGFKMLISPIDNKAILILKNGDVLEEKDASDSITANFMYKN